jgi:hypothetical protein
LIPPFPGSNPGAPASKSMFLRDFAAQCKMPAPAAHVRPVALSPYREIRDADPDFGGRPRGSIFGVSFLLPGGGVLVRNRRPVPELPGLAASSVFSTLISNCHRLASKGSLVTRFAVFFLPRLGTDARPSGIAEVPNSCEVARKRLNVGTSVSIA